MAIRIDDVALPVTPGVLQPVAPDMPTIQPVPSVPGGQSEQGTDSVAVQSEQTTAEADPQGLNIPHDQRDRNKGAGIRI